MKLFSLPIELPFPNSASFLASIKDTEAIDYFFAKQIFVVIAEHANNKPSTNDLFAKLLQSIDTGFFLLVALSCEQRRGSVCLHLAEIAGKALWTPQKESQQASLQLNDDQLDNIQAGFTFPSLQILQELSELMVACCPTNTYLHFEAGNLYSRRYYSYEKTLCDFIRTRINCKAATNLLAKRNQQKDHIQALLAVLFNNPIAQSDNIDLQQLATLNSICHQFSIITGGAGTGKTYTITRLLLALSVLDNIAPENIALLAPTGKAANRLKQSLYDELEKLPNSELINDVKTSLNKLRPQTIHNLLKIDPQRGQSKYSELNPLYLDLLIVDESSMVDISLMDKVICALPSHTVLILIGDSNQLPSVETGSLLADLVAIDTAYMDAERLQQLAAIVPELNEAKQNQLVDLGLMHNTRQSEIALSTGWLSKLLVGKRSHDSINVLSQAILRGDPSAIQASFNLAEVSYHDYNFGNYLSSNDTEIHNQQSTLNLQSALGQQLISCYTPLLQAENLEEAFAALSRFNLLTPYRRGRWGVESLNIALEGMLSKQFRHLLVNGFYPGKPIMVLSNDYQLGLFNGDVGIIWPDATGQLKAFFKQTRQQEAEGQATNTQSNIDHVFVSYPIYSLPSFETSYAMTIHKTQGSEYDHIELLIPESETDFLNRQLVYTAVTRAKKSIGIWSQFSTLTQAVAKEAVRVSGVNTRIC